MWVSGQKLTLILNTITMCGDDKNCATCDNDEEKKEEVVQPTEGEATPEPAAEPAPEATDDQEKTEEAA